MLAVALGLSRNLGRSTMSPVEDRPKTRDRPDAAEPLERPRSDLEAPHRGLSEDHYETSIRPVGIGSDESHARDLDPPCKSPDQAPSETSKGPRLPETIGSPGRDRVETVAIPRRAALTCPAARSPVRTAFERLRRTSPRRLRPQGPVTLTGKLPAQRPPEGPGQFRGTRNCHTGL